MDSKSSIQTLLSLNIYEKASGDTRHFVNKAKGFKTSVN